MSKYTTGRQALADLEKRVGDMERRLNALHRQQLDSQHLVSKSPSAGVADALARLEVRIAALENPVCHTLHHGLPEAPERTE